MKIPLIVDIGTRDGTLNKDALCTNLIAGQRRPGLGIAPLLGNVSGIGVGRGVTTYSGRTISVSGNTLYQSGMFMYAGPPVASIPIAPIDLTSAIGVDTCPVDLLVVGYSTAAYIVVKGFNGALTLITPPTSGSPTVTTPANSPYGVSGLVMLDSTLYVLDNHGNIVGSALGDVTTWNPLNTIQLDRAGTSDHAQCLAKHLNYLVAFSVYSVQFFYDNGNPGPGSPLSAAPSLLAPIGCSNPFSVAAFSAGLIFLSMTQGGKLGVHVIIGTSPEKVSTDAVDKFLGLNYSSIYQDLMKLSSQAAPFAHSCVTAMNGREVYVLYLPQVGVTLAYDIAGKQWSKLTKVTAEYSASGVPEFDEAPYTAAHGTDFSSDATYLQDVVTSAILEVHKGAASSDTAYSYPVVARAVTAPVFDAGTDGRFRVASAEVLGDKASEIAYLAYSDDDYNTWCAYRPVDLGAVRSRTVRDGSTHRRSYRLQYSGDTLVRFSELVLDIPERNPT